MIILNDKSWPGQKLSVKVRTLGIHGEGVADYRGYTLFVDGALPGEIVNIETTVAKKNYGIGRLIDIAAASPDRCKPICPLAGTCGGCQVMHLSDSAQLVQKRQRVVDALERIGRINHAEVAACIPSPASLYYRNKVQAPIRNGKKGLQVGFYARNSHQLVEVDTCYIHCPLGQKVYEITVSLLKSSGLNAYDWESGKGFLRHLIIKTAVHTRQALVVFVTAGKGGYQLKEIADAIRRQCPEVKGVIQNINFHPHNVVFGKEFFVISGEESIVEEILGLRFRISPASFFQVNPDQAKQLYQQVIDWADLSGNETVVDAYCGVGTLALLLSGKAGRVFGVECVFQAIENAIENAALNKICNATFICEDAAKWIQTLDKADVVILNPPRKGCDPSLIQALAKLSPLKIIYVSCDPATLARDLNRLEAVGYCIDAVQPFDMFPQTAHVETVVKLHRLRPQT